jgi:DEAD/DEAH box helicase domain-containing protein
MSRRDADGIGEVPVFAVPVLEAALEGRATSLFIYPTKALAQDQLAALRVLACHGPPATAPVRDLRRGYARSHAPEDQAEPAGRSDHQPRHAARGIRVPRRLGTFLKHLRYVVLDELHVYRVFGAHVHHILRRLKRLTALHGASPRFIAASATVGRATSSPPRRRLPVPSWIARRSPGRATSC